MNQTKKRIGAGFLAVVIALTSTLGITDTNAKAKNTTSLHAPTIKDTVTWDCVYYGSYPQTEITETTNWDVYNRLQNTADWDANGDITIGTEKYHRMQKKEATSTAFSYVWENDNVYHYFKYEPIKWRVLDVKEEELYLVSDLVLDTQKFSQKAKAATWENSTLRSWLNGLDDTKNTTEMDFRQSGFIHMAFTSEEQEQLLLFGDDNIKLLAENEVNGSSYVGYGFVSDEARRCQSSDYAKARGVATNEEGFSNWWLATSGNTALTARYVGLSGAVYEKGYSIAYAGNGVRVAIGLNCKNGQNYTYAGTVSSDGTHHAPDPSVTLPPTPTVIVTAPVPLPPTTLPNTPTPTVSGTITPPVTATPTPTQEATPTPTDVTPTPNVSVSPSPTVSITASPTPSVTVSLTPTASPMPTTTITPTPTKVPAVKKGTIYTDKKSKAIYKVTKVSTKNNGTVQYMKPTSNKVTAVTIPASIKIYGKTYKVTSIGNRALQKKTKLKKVVIGKNVSVIGKNAFYGCKKLKLIQIKTSKLTTKRVGKNAFKGIYKKAKIVVPAKKQKTYTKILKAAGTGKKVKITKK